MNEKEIQIEVKPPGGRLDQILADSIGDVSRTRIQKLIREGKVHVDDVLITKPAYPLVGGETVEIIIPEIRTTELQPEKIPLEIIFENHDLIALNKAAGIVVHPSIGHTTGTLVHAVLAHASDIQGIGGEHRPGVVHRLDKDTSGILLMAKNDRTYHMLQRQFSERTVEKRYIALVDGKPPTKKGRVEVAIGRDPHQRQKMAVVPVSRGREAISVYSTLEAFQQHTLLEVMPKTGRTHQIRVHMAFLKCPIVGDRIYGKAKPSLQIPRHFLHAETLTLQIPSRDEPMTFNAPLPEDLVAVLESIQGDQTT